MTGFRIFSAKNVLSRQEKRDGISRFNPTPHIAAPSFRLISLEGQARTPRHNHTETELWTVLQGSVEVDIEGVHVTLRGGDVINLSPLQRHDIRPTNGQAVLQACFWHDQSQFEEAVEAFGAGAANPKTVHILIPNWVTPNGRLHLGHASGPYIFADVARRALELAGREAIYVAGTLGHLEHIAVAAEGKGMGYYELADHNTKSISASFQRLQIKPRVFLGPRPTERFGQIVHEIFHALREAGAIEERETDVPFDPRTGRHVVDAHLSGNCPHCGARAFGHECEGCGGSMLDSELLAPTNRAGETLIHRPLKRLFLDLDKLKESLRSFRDSAVLPNQARCFVDAWLDKGLPAICITNPISHGIAVPISGYDDQRFTVFMEHAARHFLAIEEWALQNGKSVSWKDLDRLGNLELSIFFGSDNSFGRLIITPAVTGGIGAKSLVPKRCYINHFLLLDGSKFSTGRDHAIWVNEFVQESNSDLVRFFLTLVRPEVEETNFTLADFDNHVTDFWKGRFVALLRALRLRLEPLQDKNPAPAGIWGRDEIRFYKRIMEADAAIRYWYRLDTFNPALVAQELQGLVSDTLNFIHSCKPWPRQARPNLDYERTQSRLIISAVARIALALDPLAPTLSGMLADALGEERPNMKWLERNWLMDALQPFAPGKLETIEAYLQGISTSA